MNKTKIIVEDATKNETKDAAARLALLRKETAQLERKLARGTRDIKPATKIAAPVQPKPEPKDDAAAPRVGGGLSLDLGARVEAALRVHPHSLEELARELKEPVGRISTALKPLRKHLYNVGTEHAPAWFWIVGDEASASEINQAVLTLVKFKPMRFPELLAATGARQGRVSGAIVAMQRDSNARLVNLDTPQRARWFMVPEGVTLAKLKSR